MTFPYIKQIVVHNCFTYQGVNIPKEELQHLRHIIITGRNGSGKTTILKRIAIFLTELQKGGTKEDAIRKLPATIKANPTHPNRQVWEEVLQGFSDLDLKYFSDWNSFLKENSNLYIFSFFRAHRKVELVEVKTVTKESEFLDVLSKQNKTEEFIGQFKQYLVNKKVYEAFDFMNSKTDRISQSQQFFTTLRETLRSIFNDPNLELEFVQESFEFYLVFSDKRKVTFNQLSEGFSAFLSIIMDLLMRTDLIRKVKGDYTFDPPGIVLIDEPETHFHLSMQYEILPLVTKLFPNLQLIIATHSPAVISSLKDAIVFDLSSKEQVKDWILGSSFSELMIKHFGLDNEFSPIADKIIEDVNKAVKDGNKEQLQEILSQNEKFLTPALRLEIESQLITLKERSR